MEGLYPKGFKTKKKKKKAPKKGNSGVFCIFCFNQALGVILNRIYFNLQLKGGLYV